MSVMYPTINSKGIAVCRERTMARGRRNPVLHLRVGGPRAARHRSRERRARADHLRFLAGDRLRGVLFVGMLVNWLATPRGTCWSSWIERRTVRRRARRPARDVVG